MIKIMPKFLLLLLCLLLPVRSFATTVNVAVPSFSMSLIAFMAAKERGYYQQEGLDINFVLMPAAIASRALIAGNVDFATVGGSALTASLGGAPLRLLFSSFSRSLFWLYSRPDISAVKDLKGKKVGVSSIGSGPDSMLRDLLRTHGLQGGKDVTILAVGVDSSRYASSPTTSPMRWCCQHPTISQPKTPASGSWCRTSSMIGLSFKVVLLRENRCSQLMPRS